jgi:hypothetical protein
MVLVSNGFDYLVFDGAEITRRNPKWLVPVDTSPLPRVPTV